MIAGFDARGKPRFYHCVVANFQRVGVQQTAEVSLFGRWVFHCEQTVIIADFDACRRRDRYPVERTLYFAVASGESAAGFRIVGGVDFCDLSGFILDYSGAFYYVPLYPVLCRDYRGAQTDGRGKPV